VLSKLGSGRTQEPRGHGKDWEECGRLYRWNRGVIGDKSAGLSMPSSRMSAALVLLSYPFKLLRELCRCMNRRAWPDAEAAKQEEKVSTKLGGGGIAGKDSPRMGDEIRSHFSRPRSLSPEGRGRSLVHIYLCPQ